MIEITPEIMSHFILFCNSDKKMYSTVQKALFPFVSIPSMLLLYILYHYVGMAPIRHGRGFGERMEPFYSFTASAIVSKFLFQSLPNATGPTGAQVGALVSGFVMIGLFIMLCIQKCQRVSHLNPYYTSPELNVQDIRSIINHETMELQEYYQATDLDNPSIASDKLQLQDELAELRKRRHICYLLLGIMSFLAIMEGFFLVYAEPTVLGGSWAVFSFFQLNKLIDSCIVGVVLLHAYIHARVEGRWNWYRIIAIYWSVLSGITTLPVLVGMEWSESFKMVNNLATGIFYAFAGGFLLWIGLYFIWIDKKKSSKRENIVRLTIFAVTAAMCCLVAFFV
jgi:zinc transporter ZupT